LIVAANANPALLTSIRFTMCFLSWNRHMMTPQAKLMQLQCLWMELLEAKTEGTGLWMELPQPMQNPAKTKTRLRQHDFRNASMISETDDHEQPIKYDSTPLPFRCPGNSITTVPKPHSDDNATADGTEYASDEAVAHPLAMLRVRDLNFTHDIVHHCFRNGRRLEDLMEDLRCKRVDPMVNLKPLKVYRWTDRGFHRWDNRRLKCLKAYQEEVGDPEVVMRAFVFELPVGLMERVACGPQSWPTLCWRCWQKS
jgi:hypothetical protein